MAPKTPSNTTQTTKVELPKWVDEASQQNYKDAQALADQPDSFYTGPRVADMGSATKQAIEGVMAGAGSSQVNFDKANGIFDQIAKDAKGFNAGTIADADLSKYMNPYIDEVESKSLAALDKSRLQSLNSNASAAQAAGAFGGSRAAIIDAVTNAETADKAGLLSSQLRSAGFDKALSSAQQDITNRTNTFNAQQTGQNSAAQGLMASATAGQTAKMQDFAALLQSGQLQQNQAQALIDSDMSVFNQQRDRDIEDLNLKLSALGMSPYGKTETANKTSTGGSSGTDIGQMGLGIFSLLLGLSEDDEKTDKKKIGKVPGTDLDLWSYRYKGDPKSYPKVVGPMASDIEKKMPDAVHRVNGKRIVNYGLIEEAMRANG